MGTLLYHYFFLIFFFWLTYHTLEVIVRLNMTKSGNLSDLWVSLSVSLFLSLYRARTWNAKYVLRYRESHHALYYHAA